MQPWAQTSFSVATTLSKENDSAEAKTREKQSFPLNGSFLCSKRKDSAGKKSWKEAGDILSKILDMNNNEQKHSCLLFI